MDPSTGVGTGFLLGLPRPRRGTSDGGRSPHDRSGARWIAFSRRLRHYRFGLLDQAALAPEPAGDVEGVDPSGHPPAPLVADPVHGAVVCPAQRQHEFVADPAAERPLLGEAEMVWVAGLAAANETSVGGHEPRMGPVAIATRLGDDAGPYCGGVMTSAGECATGSLRLPIDDAQKRVHGAVEIAPTLFVGLHCPRWNAEQTLKFFGRGRNF